MTTEGHCEACTSGDVLLLFGVAIAVLGVLCCVYVSVAMDNRAKQKEPVALLIIVGVQVVTVIQILSVFNMLTTAWPDPFDSIVRLASLFKFKILTLNVGCVASMTALMEYTFTTLGVGGLVLAMVGIHVTYHCVFATRRESGMFQPTLIGAVGTILMAIARRLLQNSVKRLVSTSRENWLLKMLESFQDVDGEHPRLQVQGRSSGVHALVGWNCDEGMTDWPRGFFGRVA